MRYLSLLFILLMVVSCGKDSSSSGPAKQQEEMRDTVDTTDGLGVDLLDTSIDVSAKVTDSQITFLESKSSVAQGRRIDCKSGVNAGEVYQIALNGDQLSVQTAEGTYNMSRLNEGNSGLTGSFSWKGYSPEGEHMIKIISFLGNRVILKTHCEM